ncbi:MAG: DinB family protein [Acidimicrobiales bacterium]|nr:DinB family protein [Acidimicrobiales bacterium]
MLERPCPDCGFDAAAFPVERTGDAVRALVVDWSAALAAPQVAVRPSPGVWSTLEYACHVRDVFRLFDRRLAAMLQEDDPLFANWDQDETAVADRYGEQDPVVVQQELADAGSRIAEAFDAVDGDQWERPGRRSDGAAFTVASFARYFLHDPLHHLWDIGPTR